MKEIEIDGATNEVDNESIVLGEVKEEKVVNPVKKSKTKSTIKGLRFDNVSVIYINEVDKKEQARISLTIPAVEGSWWASMIRKAMNLYFYEQNILPTQVLSVSLPSAGGKEVEMDGSFLDKPFGELTKADVVNAAIYHRHRTVAGALHSDEEEMRQSLWLHMAGSDMPYDATVKVSAVK